MKGRLCWLGGLWLCAAALALAADGAAPEREAAGVRQADAVDQATAQLRQLPELGVYETQRVLRWKAKQREPAKADTAGIRWLSDFVRWFGEAGRVLMWALGGLAAVLALRWARQWFVHRPARRPAVKPAASSHVGQLDIRPDRLPEDVAAAAWQAWQGASDAAQRRAALSLLYRGALSHLVHRWGVPIVAASTEQECVALAERCFARDAQAGADRLACVAALVAVWQQAVYGLRQPTDTRMHALCVQFKQQLADTGASADVV